MAKSTTEQAARAVPATTGAGEAAGRARERAVEEAEPAAAPKTLTSDCPVPNRVEPRGDRPRYELDVDVRLNENAVVGHMRVRFTPDIATDRIVLRLWPNGPRLARAGARLDVFTLRVDGETVPAAVENPTTLVARPPRGIDADQTVEMSLPWRLRLPGPTSDRISRRGDAVRLGSFFPILAWEPGVGWATDPPTSAFAEDSMAPTADFSLRVTPPPGLTAIASGVYDSPGHWTANGVRDVAISVGQFALAGVIAHAPGPVQVTVGVHAGIAESPGSYASKVARVLTDLSSRYGSYPWPTYTLAITPDLGGGIEYPMHVMQGPRTLGRTTSHEVAHMWFYGLVGNDQGRDPWLDEGFASFAEARVEGTLASFRARSIPTDARGRLGSPMAYWEGHQSSYYRGVYVQGVQALAALGPAERVDCALRAHTAANANRISTNAATLDALSRVFPNARQVLAGYGVRG